MWRNVEKRCVVWSDRAGDFSHVAYGFAWPWTQVVQFPTDSRFPAWEEINPFRTLNILRVVEVLYVMNVLNVV